ncbi:MAG: phage major capsid protein [Rhodospirillales bacterium]|nr:phage major capsid protein [Rhodospirillales bacterium]
MTIGQAFNNLAEDGLKELTGVYEDAAQHRAHRKLSRLAASRRVQVHDNSADRPWANIGEFLRAVRDVELRKRPIDVRLAAGLNEGVSSEGGFLVESDIAAPFIEAAFDEGAVSSRCAPLRISNNASGTTVPTIDRSNRTNGNRSGGVSVYWAREAAQYTATTPKPFQRVKYEMTKLSALCYATDELLEDSALLSDYMAAVLPAELSFVLDDAILSGDGAGVPLGVLNAPCLVTVAAEGGQSADTFTATNASKMYARLPGRSKRRAVWLMNADAIQQALLFDKAGPVVFTTPTEESEFAGFMNGRGVIEMEQCSAIGDLGDVILADFSQYGLATKGGIQQQTSMHVRFDYDETAFKFTLRVDGRPLWNSASTPTHGSNSQSPFVTLAAR